MGFIVFCSIVDIELFSRIHAIYDTGSELIIEEKLSNEKPDLRMGRLFPNLPV